MCRTTDCTVKWQIPDDRIGYLRQTLSQFRSLAAQAWLVEELDMKILCPHCGAEKQIRESQLGQKVTCQHCSHSFTAHTPNGEDTPPCASRENGDEIFDTAYCYGAPRHSASLVIIANKCQHLFFLVLGSCLLCWIIVAATICELSHFY